MSKKKKDQFEFNSTDFINYVWQRRKPLLAISLLAAVVSTIVSLTITPKFKSAVVMFPATASSISKSLLSDGGYSSTDNLMFGEEEESEQLMQILNSEKIKGNIIRKFNLMKHYNIDSLARFAKTSLLNEYDANIKFRRTEYMSLVIEVMDKDPFMAADMANEISNQLDTVMDQMQHERALKSLEIVENEYVGLQNEIKQMQDSLTFLMKAGVTDYDSQVKAYNEAYAKAIADGKMQGAQTIERKMAVLTKYGSAYISLKDLLKRETKRLSLLGQKYMEAKVDAERTLPHKFIVDRAYESERKAYPKRSLIVLISTVSAFFLALLAFVVKDSIKIQ
jgi:uncharacterized protein involved in exopolysaccharide biosynthesis